MSRDPTPNEEAALLAEALRAAAEAAKRTADALGDLAAALQDAMARPYRAAGHPFGRGEDGLALWHEYGQATTTN